MTRISSQLARKLAERGMVSRDELDHAIASIKEGNRRRRNCDHFEEREIAGGFVECVECGRLAPA